MTADEARTYLDALPDTFDMSGAHLEDARRTLGAERVDAAIADGMLEMVLFVTGVTMMSRAAEGTLGDTNTLGYSQCCWTAAKRVLRFLDEHPEHRYTDDRELHSVTTAAGLTYDDVGLTPLIWGWAVHTAKEIFAGQPVLGPIDSYLQMLPTAQ